MGVTSAIVMRAKLCGACSDGLPREGTPVARLTQSQMAWADENEVASVDEIAAEFGRSDIPLSLLSRSGSGCGSGDGSGYGDGYGYGDGSGYGYGYGDGSGYGYGYGSGYGYGDGYGYGSGYGYGDGSGYGSGLNLN